MEVSLKDWKEFKEYQAKLYREASLKEIALMEEQRLSMAHKTKKILFFKIKSWPIILPSTFMMWEFKRKSCYFGVPSLTIENFLNWLIEKRQEGSLPNAKIE